MHLNVSFASLLKPQQQPLPAARAMNRSVSLCTANPRFAGKRADIAQAYHAIPETSINQRVVFLLKLVQSGAWQNPGIRQFGLEAINQLPASVPEKFDLLKPLLSDSDWWLQSQAYRFIVQTSATLEERRAIMEAGLQHEHGAVRVASYEGFCQLPVPPEEKLEKLKQGIQDNTRWRLGLGLKSIETVSDMCYDIVASGVLPDRETFALLKGILDHIQAGLGFFSPNVSINRYKLLCRCLEKLVSLNVPSEPLKTCLEEALSFYPAVVLECLPKSTLPYEDKLALMYQAMKAIKPESKDDYIKAWNLVQSVTGQMAGNVKEKPPSSPEDNP